MKVNTELNNQLAVVHRRHAQQSSCAAADGKGKWDGRRPMGDGSCFQITVAVPVAHALERWHCWFSERFDLNMYVE